jgi:hypothetical protein
MKKTGRPVRMTPSQLARLGVVVVGSVHEMQGGYSTLTLRCTRCGVEWSHMLITGGHLPLDYWKCPNGCNATKQL